MELTKEEIRKRILDIEDEIYLNESKIFYHAFAYDEKNFDNMITEGIKCPLLVNKKSNGGWNGKYYISLSKNLNIEDQDSAYETFVGGYPMFMIKNIVAFKASNDGINMLFQDSILPFRPSQYCDEYQAFFKITPDKIIGIQYELVDNAPYFNSMLMMEKIINQLRTLGVDIPIYDCSFPDTKRILDQEKYLSLVKNLKK